MSALGPDLLRRVAALGREGIGAAMCMIVSDRGSTPQSAGAIMFVDELGRVYGTIGGGCIEADVRRRAMPMIERRQSGILNFRLDGDQGWDDGLICGGSIEVAVAPALPPDALEHAANDIEQGRAAHLCFEVCTGAGRERITLHRAPRPRLCIAGAGHIGQATARLALALDFDVTVFDDRPDLLARFAPPLRTVCGPIAQRLAEADLHQVYCLIVTRGHRHDAQALAAVLSHDGVGQAPHYIGMIGSRRKVAVTFDDLESRGIPRDRLDAVCAPVGLAIGSQTVEEIAVSIAAQLVQTRSALRGRESGYPTDRIERVKLSGESAAPPTALIGVLLAAGQSRRMGQTKQTMPLPTDPAGRALVAAAFDAVAPACSRMVVVVAHDAEAVCEALGARPFQIATAPQSADMFESILTGLGEAARLDASASVLLHLADHPRVTEFTLAELRKAAQDYPDRAVMPTFENHGGHPVLIPPSVVKAVLEQGSRHRGGLREFWTANPERCLRLPVADPSVVLDIDFPCDYRDLMQGATP